VGRARAKPTIPDERKGGFRPSTHPTLAKVFFKEKTLASNGFENKMDLKNVI
jgi:hypothetical protein